GSADTTFARRENGAQNVERRFAPQPGVPNMQTTAEADEKTRTGEPAPLAYVRPEPVSRPAISLAGVPHPDEHVPDRRRLRRGAGDPGLHQTVLEGLP